MTTKKEFISKWSSWWVTRPKEEELTEAFERELNSIIEQEVASKNLVKPDVSGQLLAFFHWMKENKHRYMFTDEKRFVEEFLKASNLR